MPSSAAPIRWVRVSIAGLSVGRPRWVDIPRTGDGAIAGGPPASPAADHSGAWLVMGADGGLAAFDAHCTHQACLYDWDTAATRFACRCHKGFFALDGRVISGPPPRPLDRFETRLDGRDVVEIAWQDRRPLER